MANTQNTQTVSNEDRPNLLIVETLKTTGALFNIKTEDRTEGGPIMSGSIEIGEHNMPVSGFLEVAESSLEYLALSLGGAEKTHYYGKLFRNTEKKNDRSPDYTGFITVLACEGGSKHSTDVWDEAPTLRVTGKKMRNSDGTARVALTVAPTKISADELNF